MPAGYPDWAKAVMSVSSLRQEYPLELLLRVSGMSRSTYYHRARSLRSRDRLTEENALISDIFHGSGRRLYLSSIMDLHSNMVLAHSVSSCNSWPMVREMLERLEKQWGIPRGIMIHSDQGGLYRCLEYMRFAERHGVVRSMSGKGCCYDNAVIESHFGNLKGRLGRLDRVPAEKASEMIGEAVRYFNEERIMLKLGGLSPAEYLRKYMENDKRGQKTALYI